MGKQDESEHRSWRTCKQWTLGYYSASQPAPAPAAHAPVMSAVQETTSGRTPQASISSNRATAFCHWPPAAQAEMTAA